MNESEKDITGLVNAAFVGRQLASADTNRFAGGIIGNQNNSTSSDWVIENCINYGTVYCYNTHYAGGIMDSGPEPAERYRTAEIMVCYRQPMERTG